MLSKTMYGLFDHENGFICGIQKDESDPNFSEPKNLRKLENAIKLACAMVNEDEVEIKKVDIDTGVKFFLLKLIITAHLMDGSIYECELHEVTIF